MLSLKSVGDEDLLCQLSRLVKQARGVEAEVAAHVGEVERRRLHAREACSSMFEYCRRILGMRENEAYLRITVARAAREYPVLLEMLRDGRLHLSGIARLAPHLTCENAQAVLARASGMSHRGIRELVAELAPRPDVAPAIRKLPERSLPEHSVPLDGGSLLPPGGRNLLPPHSGSRVPPHRESLLELGAPRVESAAVKLDAPVVPPFRTPVPARPAVVEPLAPARYQVRFTASAALRDKLERLQVLMRATVPDGDLARIIEIAVSEKLQRVEAKRFGRTKVPRSHPVDTDKSPSSRHIPAAVRRMVYARDGRRCAYRDRYGRRCDKRHDLEFHHKHPFAHGGDHSPANLALMCKTHNTLLAEQDYGADVMARFRAGAGRASVPVDAYGARIVVRSRGISSA